MKLIEYPDRDMMMMDLADRLAGELKSALLTHEAVTFAVPGGTTPGPVFDTLSAVHLDWPRVTVVPTDERCVPPETERSNSRLIRERLLTGTAAKAGFLSLYEGGAEISDETERAGAALLPLLPVDVLLLGMGPDLHIASLFPEAPGLDEALDPHAPPIVAVRPPLQPEPRVSLSGPVLSGAISTHVVVTGAEKRDALENAEKLPLRRAPVQTVLTNATVHWAE